MTTEFKTGYAIKRLKEEPCVADVNAKNLVYTGGLYDIPHDVAMKTTGMSFDLSSLMLLGCPPAYKYCIIYKI